ncbi:MAG: GIY-YIG nuclease family protein, partial [Chitinophagales bacterium]|nr:GIY-YIG nuclease family protein [Chitinophagales bacterium]
SNLIERFKSHNTLSNKGYTVRFRPWYVIHIEFFYNKKQAMEREHYFKSGIGRKWLDENTSIEI